MRSPELPRWFGPPFVPSVARGVGSKVAIVCGSLTFSGCGTKLPVSLWSLLVGVGRRERALSIAVRNVPLSWLWDASELGTLSGVGSNDEDTEPSVRGTHVGSA
jgi:hypothetical protein